MFSHWDQPSWQLRPLHLLQFPNNSHGNETSLQKPSSLCRKTRPKSFARMVNLPACLKHKPCFPSSFLLCLFPLDTGCSRDAHTGIKSPHNHLSEELNSTNSLLSPPPPPIRHFLLFILHWRSNIKESILYSPSNVRCLISWFYSPHLHKIAHTGASGFAERAFLSFSHQWFSNPLIICNS